MTHNNVENIHWLGHDSFRIDGVISTIYLDPWKINRNLPPADVILITHDHHDHCSPEDVLKIQTKETVIVTVEEAAEKLSGNIHIVHPGDEFKIRGVEIHAVPAYNVNKFRSPGVPFHPKEKGYVGFIINIDGRRIYHAGDTDIIPEMSDFEVDIAILPVSGTYVMTADEAVTAAKILNPLLVIPMHVGRGIGSEKDLENFKKKSVIPVMVLPFEGQ